MTQPFVDCAIRLADEGVRAEDVRAIVCEVAAGTVPRLWEPLASKHLPPSPYAAKFSTPFCMAVGFIDRKAGLGQFSAARVQDPAVLALAAKIHYEIDPTNEYPRKFTGHLRATLRDGTQREFRQAYLRGGAEAPLSTAAIEQKFMENVRYGGWTGAQADGLLRASRELFCQPTLESLKEFRA
jgi:2-methylcitrate dehydratase PrpD